MGYGIIVCGLNGSGKSTVGRALAETLGYHFIDNENLFFTRSTPNEPYTNPFTRAEAEALLAKEVRAHENFVFSAVKGDYGADITPLYRLAVLIEVPKEIRSQRIRQRSYQKFGERMCPGGDLYESEEAFFRFAEARDEDYVRCWTQTLSCPVICIDGTKPIYDNVKKIIQFLRSTSL
ncbi:MAG: AAA family ATPase [Clostridia bacterium]|nr:AAA family ATPase [Clostridia bacterium]